MSSNTPYKAPAVPSREGWSNYFQAFARTAADPRLKHFYQAGTLPPDTPLAQADFIAMDFETTGLDPLKDAIVSIGLVPFTLSRIRCNQARHYLVKPRRDLVSESIAIHGITHSDVEEAPDLDQILEDLLDQISGKLVVVHYRQIERDFLHQALLKRLNEGLLFPVIDTMTLEHGICRKQQNLMERLLRSPLPSLRLPDIRERYGLPRYHLHHAMTDALATAELLQAQIAHAFDPQQKVKEFWE